MDSNGTYHRDLSVASDGRRFWRSLDELSQTPEFIERLHREFPMAASEFDDSPDGLSRRNFIALMGASLALAGLAGTGCRERDPTEKIVPYVNQPEQIVPGKSQFYATALTIDGYAHGALVQSHEGRPTKIEGNPDHPASLGATSAQMQAAVLSLYDPDRSQVVVNMRTVSTWDAFRDAISKMLATKQATRGAGMRILSTPVTSPTLAGQMVAFKQKYPAAQWHQYSPCDRANIRAGAMMAFGRAANAIYHFDRADVILSLDSDFLSDEPGSLRYARQFIDRRRVRKDRTEMNRLYVLESSRSITGAAADHRLPVLPDQIATIAQSLSLLLNAQPIGYTHGEAGAMPVSSTFLSAVVEDLKRAGKSALVVPGPSQPPAVHAMCHAINSVLGAAGNTVTYTDPIEYDAPNNDGASSLAQLVADINAGAVDTLIMLGGNPLYDAPANFNFKDVLEKVALRVHLSQYEDETSEVCHWHLPLAHDLEQWGDGRAFDGTISIIQPLIAPLYQGHSVHELMSMLLGDFGKSAYEIIRASWRQRFRAGSDSDFETYWAKSLHDGFMENTAQPAMQMRLRPRTNSSQTRPTTADTSAPNHPSGLRIVFRPDPSIGDGAWSNNGWLQELPKPISKLTWDNAALISPATAQKLGLENESKIELKLHGRSVLASTWIIPGLPDDCVTAHFGYGRSARAVKTALDHGFNAYAIRTSDAPWFSWGLEVVKQPGHWHLANTQQENLMHGRDLVRVNDIEDFKNGREKKESGESKSIPLTLYPDFPLGTRRQNAWGMSIDINACIGCNACMVACVSENNIPVVGKDQVIKGRAMHWLRVDTYFASATEHVEGVFEYHDQAAVNPETYFQPVPCMHCENAPCELVCPVGATVHDVEGTNNMVYNRCVGTRYCSNNCPYKVRHFNFLQYSDMNSPSLTLMRNPDVTVRERGVMEKCSYCIQRIDRARIESKKDPNRGDGWLTDGEVVTACQQACPTQAIVFGNINDKDAKVTKLKQEPANYGLLEELNTKPRTTYLARFRNPNPAIKQS